MAVSIATANAMLGGLPGTLYVQAHSGDPGASGTANVIAGPTRGTVTLPAAAGGQRSISANVDCPGVPQGAAVSHVSYWDAPSGGTFRFAEPLGVTVAFAYAGTLRFTSQVFTVDTQTGGAQTSTSVVADFASSLEAAVGRLTVVVSDTTISTDAAVIGSFVTDTTSSAESNAINLGVVVTDTTTQSDTAARGGAVSNVTDVTTASDGQTISQAFLSANTDTASGSDSNTASASSGGGTVTAPTMASGFPRVTAPVEGYRTTIASPSMGAVPAGTMIVAKVAWVADIGAAGTPTCSGSTLGALTSAIVQVNGASGAAIFYKFSAGGVSAGEVITVTWPNPNKVDVTCLTIQAWSGASSSPGVTGYGTTGTWSLPGVSAHSFLTAAAANSTSTTSQPGLVTGVFTDPNGAQGDDMSGTVAIATGSDGESYYYSASTSTYVAETTISGTASVGVGMCDVVVMLEVKGA